MGDQEMKKKLFTIFNEDGTTLESPEQRQYLLLLRFRDDCMEKTFEILTSLEVVIEYLYDNINYIDFFNSDIYQSHDRADSPTKINKFVLDCFDRGEIPDAFAAAFSEAVDESNITEAEIRPDSVRFNFGRSKELKPIYSNDSDDTNDI